MKRFCFFLLLLSVNAFAQSDITKSEFDPTNTYPYYVGLGGIEGPFFVMQGFATGSLGLYFNENFGLSAQISSGTNVEDRNKSAIRIMKGQIYGFQATFIPFSQEAGMYFRNFFIRGGPSWQDLRIEKCLQNCKYRNDQSFDQFMNDRQESQWAATTFGFELSPGIFFKSTTKMSGEFIPFTFFQPMSISRKKNADSTDIDYLKESHVKFRILTWRLGWVF